MMSSVTPEVPFAPLIEQLGAAYGIAVAGAERLGGEVDINMRITASDSTAWFLKAIVPVASGREDDNPREHWQWRVIDHVGRVAGNLPVPSIRRTRHGSLATSLTIEGVEVEGALMTWLPGVAMGRADGVDTTTRIDLGRRAAELSRALQSLDATDLPSTHHWDVRAFGPALAGSLWAVHDPQDRAAVEAIVDRCGDVASQLDDLPNAIVHQDLNDFNVLVAPDSSGSMRVSGIIDFGDTLIGLRVGEVVVAAAYAMLRQADPVSALLDVVRGFTAELPLTARELSVIYPLAALRLCVNACTWTARTSVEPSDYGLSRMAYTWPVIHTLAAVDASQVTGELDTMTFDDRIDRIAPQGEPT